MRPSFYFIKSFLFLISCLIWLEVIHAVQFKGNFTLVHCIVDWCVVKDKLVENLKLKTGALSSGQQVVVVIFDNRGNKRQNFDVYFHDYFARKTVVVTSKKKRRMQFNGFCIITYSF
jgi:hypothetical protein